MKPVGRLISRTTILTSCGPKALQDRRRLLHHVFVAAKNVRGLVFWATQCRVSSLSIPFLSCHPHLTHLSRKLGAASEPGLGSPSSPGNSTCYALYQQQGCVSCFSNSSPFSGEPLSTPAAVFPHPWSFQRFCLPFCTLLFIRFNWRCVFNELLFTDFYTWVCFQAPVQWLLPVAGQPLHKHNKM